MTSMMNITYMTSMKYMKLMVHIPTRIERNFYIISCFLLPYVVKIIGYIRREN